MRISAGYIYVALSLSKQQRWWFQREKNRIRCAIIWFTHRLNAQGLFVFPFLLIFLSLAHPQKLTFILPLFVLILYNIILSLYWPGFHSSWLLICKIQTRCIEILGEGKKNCFLCKILVYYWNLPLVLSFNEFIESANRYRGTFLHLGNHLILLYSVPNNIWWLVTSIRTLPNSLILIHLHCETLKRAFWQHYIVNKSDWLMRTFLSFFTGHLIWNRV